jgi:hypothetical protein
MPEHPFTPLLVVFGLTGGGYAVGTWLGKVIAVVLDRDRGEWGDWGGIFLGLVGFGLSLGYFFWRLVA